MLYIDRAKAINVVQEKGHENGVCMTKKFSVHLTIDNTAYSHSI